MDRVNKGVSVGAPGEPKYTAPTAALTSVSVVGEVVGRKK
jgi:hypothetical protein